MGDESDKDDEKGLAAYTESRRKLQPSWREKEFSEYCQKVDVYANFLKGTNFGNFTRLFKGRCQNCGEI